MISKGGDILRTEYRSLHDLSLIFSRQGHAAAVVDKKVYIFGGSSGSGYGGQHSETTSDPVYLNDLFLLKGKCNKIIIWMVGYR